MRIVNYQIQMFLSNSTAYNINLYRILYRIVNSICIYLYPFMQTEKIRANVILISKLSIFTEKKIPLEMKCVSDYLI